jgi:hypothetical protein
MVDFFYHLKINTEMFTGYFINDIKYKEGFMIMFVSVSCHSFSSVSSINCLQHTKGSLKLLKLFSNRTLDFDG